MFLENGWPYELIVTFSLIVGVNRAILSVGMWKLKVNEVNPGAVPEQGAEQAVVMVCYLNIKLGYVKILGTLK